MGWRGGAPARGIVARVDARDRTPYAVAMPQYQIVAIKEDADRITKVGLLLGEVLPFPTRVPGQVYETVAFLAVEEAIKLLQYHGYSLYTVAADGRRTEVHAYPQQDPKELRSAAGDTETDNLRSLPVFQRHVLAGGDAEGWVAVALR